MKTNNSLVMTKASLLLLSLSLVFAFAVTSCGDDDDDDDGPNPSSGNPFIGTWSDGSMTVVCEASTWTARYHYEDIGPGTYTRNGNTATFNEANGSHWGTANTIPENQIYVFAPSYGVFYLTKGGVNPPDIPPGDTFPPSDYTTLTAGVWANGNIPLSDTMEQWFRFTATSSTQYIHASFGTLTNFNVLLYNSSGDIVGSISSFFSGYNYSSTYNEWVLTSGQTYYFRVWSSNPSNYGTYQIAFNTSSTAPPVSGGGGTSIPSTPTDVTASALSSSSIRISWDAPTSGGTPTYYNIWRSSSADESYTEIGWVSAPTRYYTDSDLSASTTYYYKVDAQNSGGKSAPSSYASATTNSSGGSSFSPSNPTMLTADQWSSGNIPSSGTREEWFCFTATATTQYIHVLLGGLKNLYVQVYYETGGTIGGNENLHSHSNLYISRSLPSGRTYYIKVTPYSDGDSGTYQIAFNTSSLAPLSWPPSRYTNLNNAGQWYSDAIPSVGTRENWFRFTATSATQYIHVSFDTLKSLYLQVYDSNGFAAESSTYLLSGSISSYAYTSRLLTSGQTYYIRVWPNNPSDYGTYQIAFSTSTYHPVN